MRGPCASGVFSSLTRTGRPKTYYASLHHGVLYQFLLCNIPLARTDVDGFSLRLKRAGPCGNEAEAAVEPAAREAGHATKRDQNGKQ